MIEIKNLTKTYKLNKKQMKESRTTDPIKIAVNDLTLTAKKGEIYGALRAEWCGENDNIALYFHDHQTDEGRNLCRRSRSV